jgi:hypothetical protein
MCKDPKKPDALPGDGTDCAHDTVECPHCQYWSQDHSTEVSRSMNDYAVSSQHPGFTRQYRFGARLSSNEIMITLVLEWGTLGTNVTNAHKTAVKNALKTGAAGAWSNKHSVKVTDPICGEKTLPIRFRVLWKPDDTTDARHYRINLTKSGTRSGVDANFADFDHDDGLADNSWVLKHEFGHLFLLPDEYFYSGVTSGTITYKKADGATDVVTMEPSSGIMKARGDLNFHKRYYYFAAIEAQALLRSKSGRNVVCETI